MRISHSGASFVTTATRDRHPAFEISRVAESLIETLLHHRMLGHYKLHAYVVMPDHVHLLLTPQSITLGHAMALIQRGLADRLEDESVVWEEGFRARPVEGICDLEVVRAYLHELPVRANFAPTAEMYPYSSAYRQSVRSASSKPVTSESGDASVLRSERKPVRSTRTSLRKMAS